MGVRTHSYMGERACASVCVRVVCARFVNTRAQGRAYVRVRVPAGIYTCERACASVCEFSTNWTQSPRVVRRLRDRFIEAERLPLAIEVSTKCGLDPSGVWAAAGFAHLQAGDFATAREKFARCMKVRNFSLLKMLCLTRLRLAVITDISGSTCQWSDGAVLALYWPIWLVCMLERQTNVVPRTVLYTSVVGISRGLCRSYRALFFFFQPNEGNIQQQQQSSQYLEKILNTLKTSPLLGYSQVRTIRTPCLRRFSINPHSIQHKFERGSQNWLGQSFLLIHTPVSKLFVGYCLASPIHLRFHSDNWRSDGAFEGTVRVQ